MSTKPNPYELNPSQFRAPRGYCKQLAGLHASLARVYEVVVDRLSKPLTKEELSEEIARFTVLAHYEENQARLLREGHALVISQLETVIAGVSK